MGACRQREDPSGIQHPFHGPSPRLNDQPALLPSQARCRGSGEGLVGTVQQPSRKTWLVMRGVQQKRSVGVAWWGCLDGGASRVSCEPREGACRHLLVQRRPSLTFRATVAIKRTGSGSVQPRPTEGVPRTPSPLPAEPRGQQFVAVLAIEQLSRSRANSVKSFNRAKANHEVALCPSNNCQTRQEKT
jgi:hypothetical protein